MNYLLLLSFVFIFIKLIYAQNPYCDVSCDFGNGHREVHTVCERDQYKCGPDPRCGPNFEIVRLTDEQRQMILNVHNGLRCRVSLGKESRGKQPPAKNMRVLSYDSELEFISQCWANACNGGSLLHDKCRRTKQFEHVGQNLGFVNSTADNIDFDVAMKQLIRYWYDEVALFRNEWVLDTRDRGPNFKVGHYTQMMWANTYRVGCAASRYLVYYGDVKSYEFLFVCNYGPGGNYIGLPVYKPGESGSACPANMSSNNKCKMCGSFRNVTERDDFQPYFNL